MKIVTTLIITYVFICAVIFLFQRTLQYFPSGTLGSLQSYQMDNFIQHKLQTKDGVEITTWFLAPRNEEKILVYFHGNAGNLGDRARKLKTIIEHSDYGLLAVSYRGYPGSTGNPSEKGLLLDAMAATDFLFSAGYNNKDIILYGESLGSGVAIQHALKINPAGLILEAPFFSVEHIARKIYWYLPVGLLLRDKYESYKYAKQLTIPVIIFHGNRDSVVPYQDGQKLYKEFAGRKTFITMSKAGHLEFDELTLIKDIKTYFNHE